MKTIPSFIATLALFFITVLSCSHQNVREEYLQFGEHEVHYEVRGNSPKTLVFIHGWTGSTASWKYQLDSFSEYRVVAIDLPGNGKSSRNESARYTMELFADSTIEVLKHENIKRAFFIGHSMGFSIAEVIAVKYPEACAGICSIDGAHFELPEDPGEKEKWIRFNREFARSLENEKGRDDFIHALFLPDTPKMLKDEVLKISRTVPLRIGKSMIEAAEYDRRFWMKRRMDIPCLALYSTVYQLPPSFKSDFMKMYPRAEYREVGGVSHFFMLEIPYRVNQILTDYLAKVYR